MRMVRKNTTMAGSENTRMIRSAGRQQKSYSSSIFIQHFHWDHVLDGHVDHRVNGCQCAFWKRGQDDSE